MFFSRLFEWLHRQRLARSLQRSSGLTRLTPSEKDFARAALRVFMNANPLPPTHSLQKLPHTSLLAISRRRWAPAFAALLTIVGSVGLTISAAQMALPGALLYPLKQMTEGARFLVLRDAPSKARWEIERMKRRIEEAETLAQRHTLDDQRRQDIEQRLLQHTARVDEHLKTMVKKEDIVEAVEISSELEATLGAHAKVLGELAVREQAKRLTVAPLASLPIGALAHQTVSIGQSVQVQRERLEASLVDIPVAIVKKRVEQAEHQRRRVPETARVFQRSALQLSPVASAPVASGDTAMTMLPAPQGSADVAMEQHENVVEAFKRIQQEERQLRRAREITEAAAKLQLKIPADLEEQSTESEKGKGE